jgi:hypothetical protein
MTDPDPSLNALVQQRPAAPDAPDAAIPPRAPRETALPAWLMPVAVALLLAIGVASYFVFERMRALEAALHRNVAEVGAQAVESDTWRSEQGAAVIVKETRTSGGAARQVRELEAKFGESQDRRRRWTNTLADDLVRTYRDERALAEIEHALVLAVSSSCNWPGTPSWRSRRRVGGAVGATGAQQITGQIICPCAAPWQTTWNVCVERRWPIWPGRRCASTPCWR